MNGKILLVDDDPAALKLLRDILSAAGHIVRPFNNGELALRSILLEPPELILLDIRMPGLSGFDICHRLKRDELTREIPVIFISAATDMEDKVKAFEEGGVDYITKPFQKEEVVARANTHIALAQTLQRLKKTAADLKVSAESLRLAQSIARIGHWEWDMKSGHFICSEEMCRILDMPCTSSIIEQDAFLASVHPDDRERVAAHLRKIQDGEKLDIEYRIVLRNGDVRVLHGLGQAIGSDSGTLIIGTIQSIREQEQTKMLGVIQDITERKELENRLEKQANTDYLTGCDSRRRFLERAEQEFMRARRYGGALSVLMLDLDHFKRINDNYGHQVGDAVLIRLVSLCKTQLREVDVIGRMGGEEFAIMLPETGRDRAIEVAERLCLAVADVEMAVGNAAAFHFTTSIGVAIMTAEDARIDAIINRADMALYRAKNAGRNQVGI